MSDNSHTHSNQANSIMPAQLSWRDGLPYSNKFQDVYFSSDNGVLETEYVFLQGNDLPTRWQQADLKQFTIIETGFGTGLNFLCAAKLWLSVAPEHVVLHFVSVEKYPLSLSDVSAALALWPEFAELSAPLIHQYDTLINTALNTKFISLYNHRVQLSVHIGDATEQLAQITNIADAWFLDGFSPAKNPEMWHGGLFSEMAKHAHPSTTFATFTSAGDVRRGLINVGFKVNKRTGFGKKREMLCGEYIGAPHG
jgi:tRNA 5-methylaminomethyl-2-thiouridine biosynthesis bifunctional protein